MAQMNIARATVETNISGSVDFSFSKEAAAKLSLMMSDFLYSDKEYAVISEISANAVDAHKLNGKSDVPITVQLPTTLDSTFMVSDYGPGMSEEDVYKYLTSYGETSKEGDNDQIGFWGIGSKSPAAVTDTWSIISHHNGQRKHYEVFVTDRGVPSLTKIFEGATDRTGIDVQIPVNRNNISTWIAAANRAYKYYSIKPDVNVDLKDSIVKYKSKTDNHGYRENARYGDNQCNLITTMRSYSVDYDKISQALNKLATSEGEDSIAYKTAIWWKEGFRNLDLFFDVGQIDLSISREQLQYNEKTVNAICIKLQKICQSIIDEIKTEIDPIKNGIEYRIAVAKWYKEIRSAGLIQTIIVGNPFDVVKIPSDVTYLNVQANKEVLDKTMVFYKGTGKHLTQSFTCWKTRHIRQNYDYTTTKTMLSIDLNIFDRVQVIIKDTRTAAARIRALGDNKYYILVEKNYFPKEIKVIKASKLPEVPRAKKAVKASEKRSNYYTFSGSRLLVVGETSLSYYMKEKKVVAIKVNNARDVHSEFFGSAVKFLYNQGWTILGYRGDVSAFATVETALNNLYKEMKAAPEMQVIKSEANIVRIMHAAQYSVPTVLAVMLNNVTKEWNKIVEPLKEATDYYNTTKKWKTSVSNNMITTWNNLCNLLDKKDNDEILDIDEIVSTVNKTLQKRYPMLQYVHVSYWGEMPKDTEENILRYVKLIDKE